MSRKTFPKPTKEYDESYMNNLVSSLEESTTLILEKGYNALNFSTSFLLVWPNDTTSKLTSSSFIFFKSFIVVIFTPDI